MVELVSTIKDQGLQNVVSHYKLNAIAHRKYPHLVLLKYSQIESPMGEKIVQQARGIILDANQDWQIICYPYAKFFNYGEANAAEINWDRAKVYEKLDGSLMTLYWYDNQWQVASSGSPDGSGKVNERGLTYAELFWKVWEERGYQLPRLVPQGVVPTCYMFELMTPFNRIITQQGANRLLLHGARNLLNRKELDPEAIAPTYGWECAPTYNLTTWDGVLEAAQELDPMASEGYIVCDAQFNRVKVKSPQYVALSHLKGEFSIHRSIHRMLEIVRANEGDEFLNYYPEWKALYTVICERYQKLKVAIETDYAKLLQIELQKDFAKAALRTRYPGILFSLRNRKIASVADGLAGMPIKSLETLLNIQPSKLIEETYKGIETIPEQPPNINMA